MIVGCMWHTSRICPQLSVRFSLVGLHSIHYTLSTASYCLHTTYHHNFIYHFNCTLSNYPLGPSAISACARNQQLLLFTLSVESCHQVLHVYRYQPHTLHVQYICFISSTSPCILICLCIHSDKSYAA